MNTPDITQFSTETLLDELRRRLVAQTPTNALETPREAILRIVAEAWQTSPQGLFANSQRIQHAHPRAQAMVLLRQHGLSYAEIGEIWGKDHTFALYNYNKHDDRMKQASYRVNFQRAENAYKYWLDRR